MRTVIFGRPLSEGTYPVPGDIVARGKDNKDNRDNKTAHSGFAGQRAGCRREFFCGRVFNARILPSR